MKTPETIAHDQHLAQLERARILVGAQALFFARGIEAVALDELAGYLNLPLPTVAKWFANRPALVQAVIDAYAGRIRQEFARHNAQSSTAVQELLALREWMRREVGQVHDGFFKDLEAHYPVAWHVWQDHCNGYIFHHIRNNLRWGMLQDLYRDTLDAEFLARLWVQQMSSLGRNGAGGLELVEVHHTLMEHFMAGIVTPGGAHVARRLQEVPPFY